MTRLKNIWKIVRTNYRVWQLTRQKILADVESKKELYGKVWKRKFWRSNLSENKISLVEKKDLEELRRQYRSRLFNEEDLQDLKQSEFKGPETRKFPANKGAESRATPSLGKDMWNQLKRVSIPVFNGDKRLYEGWKTAFMACVDKAPATPEYKLLQLRQYLSGETLKAVEPLGHSAAAYETAKERLERKFGGKRRQIALHL